MRALLLWAGFAVMAGCASLSGRYDDAPGAKPEPYSKEDYYRLVEQVKAGDEDVDFIGLRMAFTKTGLYRPYDNATNKQMERVFQALKQNKLEACIRQAGRLLEVNYVSLGAHYLAMTCHQEAGNKQKQKYHARVLGGLADSIWLSGNGRTPATAFEVISIPELKTFVQLMGLEIQKQALIHNDQGVFDRVSVAEPRTGDEYVLYFDIGIRRQAGAGGTGNQPAVE